ncbi:unnamed protein product [Parascedosporium putredinis]|uniref:Aminoglycoside phosphotransferase domain-containing protein n=1 Tax=Parascedosporium putredinis TaxID=1442378 RepID=A0A9P1HBN3_9PEZI|nr:unnamed protein product [Parascedosporium putredinis]CAI8002236.1 unnamed protein product [Parascedosporium putredinis]
MRVSLPVYPHHKTRAEVATLRWVRQNTNIPVPEVFSFDDSNANEIGYEWILMEFLQGTSARKCWRTMSMEQKIALTKQMATFQAELLEYGKPGFMFKNIGTLDVREIGQESNAEDLKKIAPGRLVSHGFFMGDHVQYDIPRGPFRSSHDWLSAELNIILLHHTAVLKRHRTKMTKRTPRSLPPILDERETTGLYHHDLHLNNILVNEEGEITAVLDWECVSALPLWMLAKVPKFLDGPVREEEPQRDLYADEAPDVEAENNDPEYLDNEGKNELYFIHRMEYETTQLRKVHVARLRELWPELSLEESAVKIDFFEAVSQCDGIWVKKARRWADCMQKGEVVRWDDA